MANNWLRMWTPNVCLPASSQNLGSQSEVKPGSPGYGRSSASGTTRSSFADAKQTRTLSRSTFDFDTSRASYDDSSLTIDNRQYERTRKAPKASVSAQPLAARQAQRQLCAQGLPWSAQAARLHAADCLHPQPVRKRKYPGGSRKDFDGIASDAVARAQEREHES